ncbi:unnamed protein product, partial [Prorocentrum cordatum]
MPPYEDQKEGHPEDGPKDEHAKTALSQQQKPRAELDANLAEALEEARGLQEEQLEQRSDLDVNIADVLNKQNPTQAAK